MRTRSKLPPLKLAAHFPSLSDKYAPDLMGHMFVEDISLGIMPYRYREEKGSLKVEFVGDRDGAITVLQDLTNYDRSDPIELICDLIRNVSQAVSWDGRAIYEII